MRRAQSHADRKPVPRTRQVHLEQCVVACQRGGADDLPTATPTRTDLETERALTSPTSRQAYDWRSTQAAGSNAPLGCCTLS